MAYRKNMGRRELREHLFRMLFRKEFHESQELKEQMTFYYEEAEKLSGEDRDFLNSRMNRLLARLPEIDDRISEASAGWRLNRMGKVDLTLLRLALYEMDYDDEVPVKVAINEAVELAKKYGEDRSPSFINGILGKLVKEPDKKERTEDA